MGILISKMTEESIRRYGPNLSGFFKFMNLYKIIGLNLLDKAELNTRYRTKYSSF